MEDKAEFYVEPRLRHYLDTKVKIDLSKKDKDYVILIDGYEGSGKSTFAQQIGKYVDPSLCLERICMTADEFKNAIATSQKNQCVIYDEAVTGMTAGDSISRVGKLLKSMMMQMRQKNLFVIIIMPTIFEFSKYAVLSRAKSFFHVFESGGRRGYFVGFNKKDMRNTYLLGKKTYSYKIRSRFKGRFYGKYTVNEDDYRKKKSDALDLIDDEDKKEVKNLHRDRLIFLIYKQMGLTQEQMVELFKTYNVDMSRSRISMILASFGGKQA
jgi:hypothetical protein